MVDNEISIMQRIVESKKNVWTTPGVQNLPLVQNVKTVTRH